MISEMKRLSATSWLIRQAKRNRIFMNKDERRFWNLVNADWELRGKIWPQHIIWELSIIVDFWCPSKQVAIEIDGSSHTLMRKIEHDAPMDVYLAKVGVEVLRFSSERIKNDPAGVLHDLKNFIC